LFERLEKAESNREPIIDPTAAGFVPSEYVIVALADLPRLRNEILYGDKPQRSGSKILRDPAQGTFVTRKGDSKARSSGIVTRIRRSKKSAGKAEKAS
jgi:hypothetical protein